MDAHTNQPQDAKCRLKVMKFGGTSIGSALRLRQVASLVQQASRTHQLVVVSSALAGVTDALQAALDPTPKREAPIAQTLFDRHQQVARAVLHSAALRQYLRAVQRHLTQLPLWLALAQEGPAAARARDEVLALGERLAVPLLAAVMQRKGIPALATDAVAVIRTDGSYGKARVRLAETTQQIQRWHQRLEAQAVPIVTGFIGGAPDGTTTTLGRGGSDYTAALLAQALQASVLERWTDVDGIYSANPRTDRTARLLPCLSFTEALRDNRAGQLGMHPHTLDPLVAHGIPLHVRSTMRPEGTGTLILPGKPLQIAC